MSALPFHAAAEIVHGYREHSCIDCGRLHMVPPWFKPYKEYCERCRDERIAEYRGLDNEPDIVEDETKEEE